MKKLKKCIALVVVAMMVSAMSLTAYARWDHLVLISKSDRSHVVL